MQAADFSALSCGGTDHRNCVSLLLHALQPSLAFLKCAVLSFLLLGLIFTDAETKLLPDALTLPGVALGIVFSLLVPVNDLASHIIPFVTSYGTQFSWRMLSLADSLLGAAVGASFLYGAAAIYLRARGVEGMGFGDVKLMAMIGAFVGTKLTILTIFCRLARGLARWFKYHAQRLAQAPPPHRCPQIAGRRPRNRCEPPCMEICASRSPVITRCLLAFSSESWAFSSFLFGNQFLRWYWRAL